MCSVAMSRASVFSRVPSVIFLAFRECGFGYFVNFPPVGSLCFYHFCSRYPPIMGRVCILLIFWGVLVNRNKMLWLCVRCGVWRGYWSCLGEQVLVGDEDTAMV